MNLETQIKEALTRHGTDVQTRPGAWSQVEHRVVRNHKRRIVAGIVAGALAITGAALALPRLGNDTKPLPFASQPPEPETTAAPTLQAKLPISAFGLAATRESLWGLSNESTEDRKPGEILRIDPASGDIVARIPVGLAPHGFAVSDGAVWVANGSGCMELITCGDASRPATMAFPEQNSVTRIDPKTNRVVANVAVTEPQDVDIAFGSVWVTTGGDDAHGTTLVRIDPAANQVVKTIPLGETGFYAPLTHDGNYVWILIPAAGEGGFEIARLNPQTNGVERFGTITVENATFGITSGFGSLWAIVSGSTSASALARIDTATGDVIDVINLPDGSPVGLASVTIGSRYVWATSNRGSLWRIDPTTNEPVGQPVLVGDAPPEPAPAVVSAFGSVWVATGDGKVWRFAP